MHTLYDAYGIPIDKTRLRKEEAGPSVIGVRQILSGHPAQGLTPDRLASLLLAAESGDMLAYLELAEEMEEKDLHYRSVLSTRKIQVSGLPVTVDAASDAPEDVRAADMIRDWLATGILESTLQDILDALGKGFSVCELIWDTEGKQWFPIDIKWRDPRWFEFDPVDGTTLRLRGEAGEPLPLSPAKYIAHTHKSKSGLPVRGGLARIVSWVYLFKSFDIRSWVQFAEVYGFPLRLGKYGTGATEDEKNTLLRAVRNIGQDAAAIIPESMQIAFEGGQAKGNVTLFGDMAAYFDKQISKAVLGQTGTTDTGQHVGTADAHEKVREDIERADACQLAATLNRDLVRPLIALNLGPRKRYPTIKIERPDVKDLGMIVDYVSRMTPLGLRIEESVLRDVAGFPEPAPGARVLSASGGEAYLANVPTKVPEKKPEEAKEESEEKSEKQKDKATKAVQSVQLPPALPERDEIDLFLDEELDGWEPLLSPLVDPVLALADQCDDADTFLARLPDVIRDQDASVLARDLAFAMFLQRVKATGEKSNDTH